MGFVGNHSSTKGLSVKRISILTTSFSNKKKPIENGNGLHLLI
jgi:hypothetical protein